MNEEEEQSVRQAAVAAGVDPDTAVQAVLANANGVLDAANPAQALAGLLSQLAAQAAQERDAASTTVQTVATSGAAGAKADESGNGAPAPGETGAAGVPSTTAPANAPVLPGQHVFPLAGVRFTRQVITTPFNGKQSIVAGYDGKPSPIHEALDLAANEGTPVLAFGGGQVVEALDIPPGKNTANAGGGFGGHVVIRDPQTGISTLYGHLKEGTVNVKVGQTVQAGQPIGQVGQTGNASGPHLHFEQRQANGLAINPTGQLAAAAGVSVPDLGLSAEALSGAEDNTKRPLAGAPTTVDPKQKLYDDASAKATAARAALDAKLARMQALQAKAATDAGLAPDEAQEYGVGANGPDGHAIAREVSRLEGEWKQAEGQAATAAHALAVTGAPPVRNFGTARAPRWMQWDATLGDDGKPKGWTEMTGLGNTSADTAIWETRVGKDGSVYQVNKQTGELRQVAKADAIPQSLPKTVGAASPNDKYIPVFDPNTNTMTWLQNQNYTPATKEATSNGRVTIYDTTGKILGTVDTLTPGERAATEAKTQAERWTNQQLAQRGELVQHLKDEVDAGHITWNDAMNQLAQYDQFAETYAQRLNAAKQLEESNGVIYDVNTLQPVLVDGQPQPTATERDRQAAGVRALYDTDTKRQEAFNTAMASFERTGIASSGRIAGLTALRAPLGPEAAAAAIGLDPNSPRFQTIYHAYQQAINNLPPDTSGGNAGANAGTTDQQQGANGTTTSGTTGKPQTKQPTAPASDPYVLGRTLWAQQHGGDASGFEQASDADKATWQGQAAANAAQQASPQASTQAQRPFTVADLTGNANGAVTDQSDQSQDLNGAINPFRVAALAA